MIEKNAMSNSSNPPKHGFEEFDIAFLSIIHNTVDEPVPVQESKHIANGAHRLAAALYHQRPINTIPAGKEEDYPIIADYKEFYKKNFPDHMMFFMELLSMMKMENL